MEKCYNDDCKKDIKEMKKKLGEYREFNGKLYDDIDSLEDDIREKDKFASKLSRERNKLQEELKSAYEKLEVKNKDVKTLEESLKKQKEISQQFFMKIMSENKALQKDLDEASERVKGFQENSNVQDKSKENEVIKEIILLEEEIDNLKISNADKETILTITEAEKKELVDKIEIMEAEKETAKETDVVESVTAKSLEEELCLSGFERQMFECKHCEMTFLNMNDLKYHVKEIHVDQARGNLICLQNQIAN